VVLRARRHPGAHPLLFVRANGSDGVRRECVPRLTLLVGVPVRLSRRDSNSFPIAVSILYSPFVF
jgi:hypothetical protein